MGRSPGLRWNPGQRGQQELQRRGAQPRSGDQTPPQLCTATGHGRCLPRSPPPPRVRAAHHTAVGLPLDVTAEDTATTARPQDHGHGHPISGPAGTCRLMPHLTLDTHMDSNRPTASLVSPSSQCYYDELLNDRASLVAQTVKNLPAVQEAWVRSLGGEDPLEQGMATPLQYSCLENPMDRGAWQAAVHGVTKSQMRLSTPE